MSSHPAPRRKRENGETDLLGTLLMTVLIVVLVVITSS
jgi:hypothetical protein